MPYFKDTNGKLHFIENAGFENLLPVGCVQITDEEAQLVINNHPPVINVVKKPKFTSLEFLDLFTEAEQLAIVSASMQSAQVKLWYDRTLAAMYITFDDQRTEAGLDALVESGLLGAERKAEIVEEMQ